jgi:hypothetical protein
MRGSRFEGIIMIAAFFDELAARLSGQRRGAMRRRHREHARECSFAGNDGHRDGDRLERRSGDLIDPCSLSRRQRG